MSLAYLPSQSFISFQAHQLTAASVVARNSDLCGEVDDASLLRHCAYAIGGQGTQSRAFAAVLGGGTGAMRGEDAAFAGNFEIRGMRAHALNGLALEDALLEYFWGEVLDIALPFGAVRGFAVLASGLPHQSGPGGLLIREAGIRPMHVESARSFDPSQAPPHDALRAAAAIKQLPFCLPQQGRASADELTLLHAGLIETARRLGNQMAAARARRLRLGALDSACFCLDGRWSSFHSASLIAGNVPLSADAPPFWDEHHQLTETLSALCFELRQFYPAAPHLLPDPHYLVDLYYRFYTGNLTRYFILLGGCPERVLDAILPIRDTQAWGAHLITLARGGHERAAQAGTSRWAAGRYDLGAILVALLARDPTQLALLLPDLDIRRHTVALHDAFLRGAYRVARQSGITPDALGEYMLAGARRAAVDPALFYADTLVPRVRRITRHAGNPAQLAEAVRALVREGRTLAQSVWPPTPSVSGAVKPARTLVLPGLHMEMC